MPIICPYCQKSFFFVIICPYYALIMPILCPLLCPYFCCFPPTFHISPYYALIMPIFCNHFAHIMPILCPYRAVFAIFLNFHGLFMNFYAFSWFPSALHAPYELALVHQLPDTRGGVAITGAGGNQTDDILTGPSVPPEGGRPPAGLRKLYRIRNPEAWILKVATACF